MSVRNRSKLPKSFLQYGVPRTATTLQFITVRACLCAIGHTSAHVSKTHNASSATRAGRIGTVLFVTSGAHSPTYLFDSLRGHEPWQVEARKLENAWEIPNASIWYVQNVAAVAKRDWKIIEDYREVFDLNEQEFGAVVQFMRLWDVLRRCCGPQMSLDYRMRLYSEKDYAPHLTSQSMAWDACEMYDIDQVELLFMQSILVKKCKGVAPGSINLADSLEDGLAWSKLNGTFCSLYRNAAIHEKLKFNQKPHGWPDH